MLDLNGLMDIPGLLYLASPYSDPSPSIRTERFRQACIHAADLLRSGIKVFSPIAHTHPIAEYGLPKGWDFWESFDRMFLEACNGLIVLKLDGWKESVGVQAEIRIMEVMGKPVRYMEVMERDSLEDVVEELDGMIEEVEKDG